MTTAIEYALMAGHAYRTTRDEINWIPVPQGWTPFFPVPDPTTASTFPTTGGFEAISFQNIANPNEIVISFAGTYPANPDGAFWPLIPVDIQADLALAAGMLSDQLKQAADYYLAVKASAPEGATITFTGHSLGGGLAALMAVFFGESAFTFDQAPFLNSAKTFTTTDFLTGDPTTTSVALDLRAYLAGKATVNGVLDPQIAGLLAPLDAFITASEPGNLNQITADTLAARSVQVSNINTQGEFLSSWYLVPSSNRIGLQADIANIDNISGLDLHSQALLTAMLQSGDTEDSTAADHTLGQVTFKLTDLLKMIFDKHLYAFDTDTKNTSNVNFLEHLVRHQTGGVDGVQAGGDAMVTRFTSDLWKLAQDGGMTMNEGVWSAYSNYNNISKTLIAFAMQFYYEDTANANDQNKQLFTDLGTAGVGSNGIRFDLRDVSKDIAAAMDSTDPNVKVDLAAKLNNKYILKGYEYFLNYLDTTSSLSSAERILIKSVLPTLRDWYIQAGASGMIATDTLDRGAFMLGGKGSDALVGGAKADLLVGNAGDDLLQGGKGNDFLLGGKDNDTYVYTTGDGLDTILDSDGNGSIVMDGNTLAGGAQYGDTFVHKDGSGHTYTDVGRGLVIDGNIFVQNWQAGNLGLSMSGPASEVAPEATITGTWNDDDISIDIANMANDIIDAGGGRDYVFASYGDDVIIGGAGSDALDGFGGNDRLYAEGFVSVADAIAQGNTQTGTGMQGDALSGDSGNDTLIGSNGNDILTGGAGADLLIAGSGDDYVLGDTDWAAGAGRNWGVANNTFVGGAGGIANWSGDNTDVIYAGAGNDRVWGELGNDVIFGEKGNDLLVGGSGNDVILGGDNNDILYGDLAESASFAAMPGNDYLDGGAGNDTIYGNEGDDILIGGTGDDFLYGGTGQDTYIYNVGDGVDNIYDTKADRNILRFGAGVNKDNIKLHLGSLMLDLGNGDQIHIAGFNQDDVFDSSSIGSFEFDDGTILTTNELLARGFDIDGTAGDDTLTGTNTTDRINGLDGKDILIGGAGDDVLDGGTGNDLLQGGAGRDTYLVNLGCGQDIIVDSNESAGNFIQFGANISIGNTQFHQQGTDLLINYGTQGDSVLIQNFAPSGLTGDQVITQFQFADGSQGNYTADGLGNANMKAYDANGLLVGDFWQTQNGEYGNDTYSYDAQGIKTGDSWSKSDGSHGSDVFNSDGSSSGVSYFVNGTSSVYTDDGQGNTMLTTYQDYSHLIKTGDAWSKADGSHGSDVFNSDGSSSGVSYAGPGTANVAHGSYSDDGKGDIHNISYDAQGNVTSDTWSYGNGNYRTVNDDGNGNVTTTLYDAGGSKISDTWVKADGSHGSDTFNADGSSTGAIYRVDGSYSTCSDDGQGQTITKNYNWNGAFTGSNVTETNGYHNVISTQLDAAGNKVSENWVHSDGSSGADVVGAADFNGTTNLLAQANAAVNNGAENWIPYGSGNAAFYDISNISTPWGNVTYAANVVGSWVGQVGTIVTGNMVFSDYSSLSIRSNSPELYSIIGYKAGIWITDRKSGAMFWASQYTSGDVYGYVGTVQDANWKYLQYTDGQRSVGSSLSLTLYGNNNTYDIVDLDGMGNASFVNYSMQGSRQYDMWLHNDGSYGFDVFNADGSSTGASINPDGTSSSYTNDGFGHISVMDNPPVAANLIPPLAVIPPPPLPSLTTPPGGTVSWTGNGSGTSTGTTSGTGINIISNNLATSVSSTTNSQGGSNTSQWMSNGTYAVVWTNSYGYLGSFWIQTDPGYGAETKVGNFNVGWTYDAAGTPLSRYSDDGQGNVTNYTYDTHGNVTGHSVASTNSQGEISTVFYDKTGSIAGYSFQAAFGPGQVTTTNRDATGQATGSTLVVSDGNGNIVTSNYDAAGNLLSYDASVVVAPDRVEMTSYNADGAVTMIIVTTTSNAGVITTDFFDASGNFTDSVIATPDANGNFTTCNYDATGALTSYVTTAVDAQNDTVITVYDSHGIKLNSNILQADGTEVNSIYNGDGSSACTTHNLDGSYSITSDDGLGNVITTSYSPEAVRLSDSWVKSNGSHGADSYHADGSGNGEVIYANGTLGIISYNGQGQITTKHYEANGTTQTGTSITTTADGKVLTENYSVNGIKLNDSWSGADGSCGNDTFNPDGSIDGHIYNPDGSFQDYTNDGLGTTTAQFYDAGNTLLHYTIVFDDGHGNIHTSDYDASGSLLIDSWVQANSAPTALNDSVIITEDTTQAAIAKNSLLSNDTDPDVGDVMSVTGFDAVSALGNTIAEDANGNLILDIGNRYQSLAAGQSITDSFGYTICDSKDATASGMVNITINGINDAPVATADDATALREDFVLSATGNVLSNDTDIDQDTVLSVVDAGLHQGGYGQLILNSDGSYIYSLDNASNLVQSLSDGQTIIDTFAYQATDGIAATPSTLNVTITGVNDAPVTTADDATALQEDLNIATTGNVLVNDTDVDQGTVLSVADAGFRVGSYGSLTLAADGSYIYVLDNASLAVQSLAAGQVGNEIFGYDATDGVVSTPSTLTVSITGANDAPEASVDIATVREDLIISATGNVLANDSDVDQGAVLSVADAGLRQGGYGQLTLAADGSYSYALDNASTAVQSLGRTAQVSEHFGYTATDGIVGASSVLDIFLNGTNDAPILVAPLADQDITFNKIFSLQIPSGSFIDVDQGDTLDYSATLADGSQLPDWIKFDSATQTFYGMAPNLIGYTDIRLTATDRVAATGSTDNSLATSDVFRLSISHGNEGLGNGQDAAPAGNTGNFNDGAGTSPGTPGALLLKNDILQGDSASNTLTCKSGNNLFVGNGGADKLTGGGGYELFVGGTGNDTLTTGNGYDVIAFNRGDGQDILNGGVGTDNALSLGGGIGYADLALSKTGNDLILEVGNSDQITLKNWYDTSSNYKSVLDLQVMADAMAGFDAASSDPLLNKAVQQFNFTAIVNSFDTARGANATFMHWSALDALLPAHLSGSDTAAFGGDLAHQYGKNGTLTGMNLVAAQSVINDPVFGAQAQTLHSLQGLQGGAVTLG